MPTYDYRRAISIIQSLLYEYDRSQNECQQHPALFSNSGDPRDGWVEETAVLEFEVVAIHSGKPSALDRLQRSSVKMTTSADHEI